MSAPWEMTVEEKEQDGGPEGEEKAPPPEGTGNEQGEAGAEGEGAPGGEGGEEGNNEGEEGSSDGAQEGERSAFKFERVSTMKKEVREAKAAQLRLQGKRALANHEFDVACDILTDGIALCPDSYKLYRLRSVAYACMHQFDQALADAEMVIQINPKVADGHYHKGYALYHMKKYSKSAEAFQAGLQLNPQDRTLRQGFWDAVTLLSQQSADESGLSGAMEQLQVQSNGVEASEA